MLRKVSRHRITISLANKTLLFLPFKDDLIDDAKVTTCELVVWNTLTLFITTPKVSNLLLQ